MRPRRSGLHLNRSNWIWAITIVGITVVAGCAILCIQYLNTDNDNGLTDEEPIERELHVTEIMITFNNSTPEGSSVIAHIGIENRGNVSQDLDGCRLHASIHFEGVLVDDMEMNLDGTLGAEKIVSHKFEFPGSFSSGREMTIHVTIWDADGTGLDWNNLSFTIP